MAKRRTDQEDLVPCSGIGGHGEGINIAITHSKEYLEDESKVRRKRKKKKRNENSFSLASNTFQVWLGDS